MSKENGWRPQNLNFLYHFAPIGGECSVGGGLAKVTNPTAKVTGNMTQSLCLTAQSYQDQLSFTHLRNQAYYHIKGLSFNYNSESLKFF